MKTKQNKLNNLNQLEHLAQVFASQSIKNKVSDLNNTNSNIHKHKSAESTSTLLDDIFFISKNRKQSKDTIIKNSHEKTESNVSVLIKHNSGESLHQGHHRKNSSIQIDKSLKVFGENFFPQHFDKDENSDSLSVHKEISNIGKTNTISYLIKILEFNKTIISRLEKSQDIDYDSLSEELSEILNELISSLQFYFSSFSINIEKFLLLEYIFCIIILQNPLCKLEKPLSLIKILLNQFDQNNLILLYFTVLQLSEYERKELYKENTPFINKVKNLKSLISNEPSTQFNINLQNIHSMIKVFTKDSVNSFKSKMNYKESYNMTLIITYLNNLSKNVFGDTKSKLDSILKEKITNKIFTSNKDIPIVSFLPNKDCKHKYTLVLDLDETLIHYVEEDSNAFIQIRPYAEDFIETMFNFFEIVVFTAAMKDYYKYADFVLDRFDLNKRVKHRLYREHTQQIDGVNVKDLSKLGRDIKHMLIVDNVEGNFKFHPENGFNIKNFEGEEEDEELFYLQKELLQLIEESPDDIRKYMPTLRENMKQLRA